MDIECVESTVGLQWIQRRRCTQTGPSLSRYRVHQVNDKALISFPWLSDAISWMSRPLTCDYVTLHGPCLALVKGLSLPCVVLISNKRGYTTQRGRLVLSPCSTSLCRGISLLVISVAQYYRDYASVLSLIHLFCFFLSVWDYHMHYGSHVSVATHVFFFFFFNLTPKAALLTLILRSQYQGTVQSFAWGRWQECLCFPREREKDDGESERCNKWRVGDDRTYEPIFSPARLWAGSSLAVWHVTHVSNLFASLFSPGCLSPSALHQQTLSHGIDVLCHLFAHPFISLALIWRINK